MSSLVGAAFLVCVGVAWVVMPLWALSTWTHRKSLYVRVRQPVWLLTDIAIILGLLTIIGLKQALMESGRNLPCAVSNGGAALGMVWVPGVVLCRCLQLWYALTLMELKHGRLAMVRRFYALLSGLLFLLALLAVLLATRDRALCISQSCREQCLYGSQYLLLLPIGCFMSLGSLLSWHLLSSMQRLERLGLMAEFHMHNWLTWPTGGVALGVTVLLDVRAVHWGREGPSVAAGLWMLFYATRFVALHVLPSLSYGYSPARMWCLRASPVRIKPSQLSRLDVPLLHVTSPPPSTKPRPHTASSLDEDAYTAPNPTTSLRPPPIITAVPDAPPPPLPLLPLASVRSSCVASRSSYSTSTTTTTTTVVSLLKPPLLPSASFSSSLSSTQRSRSTSPRRSLHHSDSHSPHPSPRLPNSRHRLPSLHHTNSHSPHPSPRLPNSRSLLPTPRAAPPPDPSLQDLLSSGRESLTNGLVSFCGTLLCDHWVRFLLALHPYRPFPAGPDSAPPSIPDDVLRSLYTTFLSPSAPLLAPLDAPLLRALRHYCHPLFGDPLNSSRRSSPRDSSVSRGWDMVLDGLGWGRWSKESGGTMGEATATGSGDTHDARATIARLLQVGYQEVERLLCEEAFPLFKAYSGYKGLTDVEGAAALSPKALARGSSADKAFPRISGPGVDERASVQPSLERQLSSPSCHSPKPIDVSSSIERASDISRCSLGSKEGGIRELSGITYSKS